MKELQDYVTLFSPKLRQKQHITVHRIFDESQIIEVNGSKTLKVKGDVYQLDADISWSDVKNVGLRIRESTDKTRHIDVGLFIKDNFSYVNRAFTDQPDKSKKYVESKAPFDASKKKVHLKILVDKTSIEVFIHDGTVAHSNQVFPHLNDKGITLFSEPGTAIFKNVVIKHFLSIQLTPE